MIGMWMIFGGDPAIYSFMQERMVVTFRLMVRLTVGQYLMKTRVERLHRLTPGEQYRRHVSAGGYRP